VQHTAAATGRIYERLFGECRPFALSAPWSNIPADADARACPADPPNLLARLEEEFAADDLLATGVARLDPDGQLVLSPTLADPTSGLLFFRPRRGAMPSEVLTAAGTLAGGTQAVCAALQDSWTLDALPECEDRLLAAFSIEDAIVLRSLGFPVTMAAGLGSIDWRGLQQLAGALCWSAAGLSPEVLRGQAEGHVGPEERADTQGMDPSPPAATNTPEPPGCADERLVTELVLVGWAPADLSAATPDALSAVQSHLRAVRCHLLGTIRRATVVNALADLP